MRARRGTGSMVGLYHPGNSPVHQVPASVKVAGLVLAAVVVLLIGTLGQLALAAAATVTLFAVGRIPWRVALAQLAPLLIFALPLFVFQWLTAGWVRASIVVGQILILVALAALVTLTTRVSAMLDVLERALAPLRFLRVRPYRVALVLALTIRCVPLVTQVVRTAREAQRARGLEHSPTALAVPMVIRLLKKADALGEALAARGLDD